MTKRAVTQVARMIWGYEGVIGVDYRLWPGRNWSLAVRCLDGLSVDVTSAEAWATWAADHNMTRRA